MRVGGYWKLKRGIDGEELGGDGLEGAGEIEGWLKEGTEKFEKIEGWAKVFPGWLVVVVCTVAKFCCGG